MKTYRSSCKVQESRSSWFRKFIRKAGVPGRFRKFIRKAGVPGRFRKFLQEFKISGKQELRSSISLIKTYRSLIKDYNNYRSLIGVL
jgi:hypothetical protein